ncbi:MAG: signal peptidase I [Candidatus Helarchaeota archaeon]
MKPYNKWYIYILIIIFEFFIPNNINKYKAYIIPTHSMEPTLMEGDRFIVVTDKSLLTKLNRGELIVFKSPLNGKKIYIRRIIGIEGDKITIRNKKVFINNKMLKETYVKYSSLKIIPSTISPRDNYGPLIIPKGTVFVLGDNRDYSVDSRYFGPVKKELIIGKPIIIYYSKYKERIFKVLK